MRVGTGFLRSGVARRVLAMFLLTALVPIAVAAWLSSAAVGELSAQVDHRLLERTTRQTGLQVFDRLLVAKGVLLQWPAAPGHDRLPGQERMFRSIAWFDEEGAVRWSAGDGERVAASWRRGHPALDPPPLGAPVRQEGAPQRVTLALLRWPGAAAQMVLVVGPAAAPRWLVVLEPAYLWGPMADADDAGWLVRDAGGQALVDLPLPADPAAVGEPLQTARWTLFLAAEFGARDWVFTQRRVASRARWLGWSLELWLALVAMATVLVVASLSLAQIRRTLLPLHRLTTGTRRLAAGDASVRVPAVGRDEFGDLARAFNHMAGRLEQQWRSLRGLAEIDREILQGADVVAVAQHVLATLRDLAPGTCAALLWLDHADSGTLEGFFQSSVGRQPLRLPAQRLTPAQQQALREWPGDQVLRDGLQASALAVPWLAPVCRPGVVQLRSLPVRWGGGTQAMVTLGLRREVPDAALQPAVDLRERLAVAFTTRERDRALMHRALHDSLTGLANRHGLHERLDTWLGGERPCALLFIDLDRFKQVNDGHGHAVGDELLRQAAQRLARLAPAEALVARPGGDEFVVAWPGAEQEDAVSFGEAICTHFARPFRLRGTEHFLGASVGMAFAPAHGDSREALMRAADLAMYTAKGAGRGRSVVFIPALDAQLRERLQLQGELRLALARDELRLHYQPRIDARDGTVRSAEALVRWQHPQRGLLFPGVFVPLAEESALIESLGQWVLNAACAQMARWQREGLGLQRVSVNVSPRQLASGRLLQEVREVLEQHGLAPQALELEVTESLLVGDTSEAHAQLAELRRWGLTVALDDFGTGYSSLSTLRALPIDVMKVDRAFVKDLGHDDGALAVTRAILALAGSMRLHTVAEGIETEAQAATLRGLGCDELQGFLFARPLTPEAFARLPAWAAPQPEARVTTA